MVSNKQKPDKLSSARLEKNSNGVKEVLTYKSAGVDTARKDGFIDRIIRLMRRTYDPRVIDHPWGFAGLFALTGQHQLFTRHYKKPVLVGCTDGVGTKLKIAFMMDKHDTVGIDLVAMSINDLMVQGAEPLFFLDYIAMDKVNERILLELVKGIVRGCELAGCALLGGETAEMPGFHKENEYEIAGFAVGITEQNRIISGRTIRPGDLVIGLGSDGLHSNGYSLVRKIFFDKHKMTVAKHMPELGTTLGEELLKPTRIYAKPIKEILSAYRRKKAIKGIVHITGGGLLENIPRILPQQTAVEIRANSWPVPVIFKLIRKMGNVPNQEMYRVFNMGLGLILIADPYFVDAIMHRLDDSGEKAYLIGKVTRGEQEVRIK